MGLSASVIGNICKVFFKIFGLIERVILKIFFILQKFEKLIFKFSPILYFWKIFLIIILIVILFLSIFKVQWFGPIILQGVYSIAKGINLLIILLGVLMGSSKINNIVSNNPNVIEFPLLLLGYIVAALPVLYELISLVALSSIILAVYTIRCTGKTPNTWGILHTITNVLIFIGVIGLIGTILQYILKKICFGNLKDLRSPDILLLLSISYYIVLMVILGFESMISNNVMFWIQKSGDWKYGEDCVKGDVVAQSKFMEVIDWIINTVLSILLLLLIIIGSIPLSSIRKLNNQIKNVLIKLVNVVIGMLKVE